MTTCAPASHPPVSAADWVAYFTANSPDAALPWDCSYRLTLAERYAVLPSIQQFQLGESGDGRRLLHQAQAFATAGHLPDYVPALRLFVKEEQRHSRILGRFLSLHACPHLERHWVQGAFRRIRGLAGFELRMRVLATAEVLAMPFYAALADATESPLLRALCHRILAEETEHLRFQAFTLGLLDRHRSVSARRRRHQAQALFLEATTLIVWREHRRVFRAAGWSLPKVRASARHWFAHLTSCATQAL